VAVKGVEELDDKLLFNAAVASEHLAEKVGVYVVWQVRPNLCV
jgi:hypothetical protein